MVHYPPISRISLVLCCVLSGMHANRGFALPPLPPSGHYYALAWSDEFNGASLDVSKWNYDLGVRNDATNTADAVTVGNGHMTITTYTQGGINYTGIIRSKYTQQYGYCEARIAFNDAPAMWSAFWRQGNTEIDIAEHWIRQGDSQGNLLDVSNRVQHALHWNKPIGNWTANSPQMGLSTGYHLYGVAWDATGYKFYVDNQLTRTYALADSVDVNGVNCIFSSEVRDNANIGSIPSGGYGSQSSSTVKMNVDYVRSYQVVPEPATCTLLGSAAISLLGYAWQHCRTYRRHRDARTD